MEPKIFYFQLVQQVSGFFFYITPKEYYDKEGCLLEESDVAKEILPEGFYELGNSKYQYERQSSTGVEVLKGLGMIEIDFGLNNSVEPMEGGEVEDENINEVEDNEDDINYLLNNEEERPFDYINTSTDKLLRHIKIMIMSDSFEEAEKIKKELHSRGVTDF